MIDENGGVESATMVASVSRWYDGILLTATNQWRFQPALLNGEPVKFRKRIQVNVAPTIR